MPLDKDLNITDDTRIRAAIPTLEYLVSKGAKVMLTSHLVRAPSTLPETPPAPGAHGRGLHSRQRTRSSDCARRVALAAPHSAGLGRGGGDNAAGGWGAPTGHRARRAREWPASRLLPRVG